jgi:hypothetical protein
MPFDSNGVFTRVMNWTSDQQNGIAIECGRHDQEDDNFAEGFNDTFCRDGRAAATGDFNLGQHKVKNLANGTASTDAVNKGQLDTKATPAQVTSSINSMLESLYPVGSVYIGTQATCPLATLISGSSRSLVATTLVKDVSIPSSIAVYGNGKTLGLNDGSTNVGLFAASNTAYGVEAGTGLFNVSKGSGGTGSWLNSEKGLGVTTNTDGSSGLVAKSDSITCSKITVNVWCRIA